MTNKQTEIKAPPKQTETVLTTPKKSKPRRLLLITSTSISLILITICALSLSVYNYRQHQLFNETLKQHLAITGEVQQALQQQQQQTQGLVEQLKSLQNLAKINQQTLATLSQSQTQSSQYWQLNEIKYLIQLANYNLHYQHDAVSAVNLLTLADEKLATLNNPAFLSTREALAQVKLALTKMPALDIAGLQAKLTALRTAVANTAFSVTPAVNSTEETIRPAQDLPAWKRAWRTTLAQLKQLIIIRHVTQDTSNSMLNFESRISAQHSLQYQLEQASWALLHQQEKLYTNSLEAAKNLISQLYQTDPSQQQTLLKTVDELLKVDLQPTSFDLSKIIQNLDQAASKQAENKTKEESPR